MGELSAEHAAIIITICLQLQFMPAILEWAERASSTGGTPASGRIDTKRAAVAGHSRGGKLAALQFASGKSVLAHRLV